MVWRGGNEKRAGLRCSALVSGVGREALSHDLIRAAAIFFGGQQ
jgi:hypothetical protein